jgi:hypothetical protein
MMKKTKIFNRAIAKKICKRLKPTFNKAIIKMLENIMNKAFNTLFAAMILDKYLALLRY